MAVTAEEVLIKLTQQVSGPAAEATAALGALGDALAATKAANDTIASGPVRDSRGRFVSAAAAAAQAQAATEGLAGADAAGAAASDAAGAAAAGAAGAYDGLAGAAGAAAKAQDNAAGAATKAAGASDGLAGVAKAAKGAASASGDASVNVEALAGATTILGGSAGPAGAKVINLVKFVGKLGPEATAALVAVIALVAGIALFVAGIVKGISAADEYRDELLKFQGAAKGSASAAHEIQAALDAVSPSSAVGRDKLAGYAQQLAEVGIAGADMATALEAASIAASAGGDELAAKFIKDATAAHAAGQSVDALAKKIKDGYGATASAAALSLSVQFSKLGENITRMFGQANIEPLLRSLALVLKLFDANSASGKAMGEIIKSAVEGAIRYTLKLATAMLNAYTAIRSNALAWTLVRATAYAVLAVLAAILVIVGLLVAAFVIMAGVLLLPFILAIAAVMLFWDGLKMTYAAVMGLNWGAVKDAIVAPFAAAWDYISGIDLSGAAENIIGTLVSGFLSGIGSVVSAMTSVGDAAASALKSALGIHSPSRVAVEAAQNVTGTFADTTEAGTPDVRAAFDGMIDTGTAAGAKATAQSARTGGRVVYIETLNVGGGREDARSFLEVLRSEWQVEVLDGSAA